MDSATQIAARQIFRDEGGAHAKPYRDPQGYLTVGVGRCIELDGLTGDEMELLFKNDLTDARIACGRLFLGWDSIDPVRQAALMNMAFNLGESHLRTFVALRAAVAGHNWPAAAHEAVSSLWARQVKQRARRIAKQLATGVEQ